MDAITGKYNRSGIFDEEENPFLDKFEKIMYLLKYVNWLNSIGTFQDIIYQYNQKTNLEDIVNRLYNSYHADNSYRNELDNTIRELAGLAMRGVPDDEKRRYNAEERAQEGKAITNFDDPTNMMIDNYFSRLYPRVERVSRDMD